MIEEIKKFFFRRKEIAIKVTQNKQSLCATGKFLREVKETLEEDNELFWEKQQIFFID